MRLPLIAPQDLTPEQKPLYDDMRKGITSNFNDFIAVREDGALMGPWNPWLHEPAIGKAIWNLTLAMTANATLPDKVRQIAILVVGARYDAAYEIYAHIAVAEREGMPAERLATLVADVKPVDSTSRRAWPTTWPTRSAVAARCRSRCTAWRWPPWASMAPTS
jgi:alkylhydroperoxidase family enzyme